MPIKNRKRPTALQQLGRQVENLLDHGKVDSAWARRKVLRDLCRSSAGDPYRPQAQALCANLYLVSVERDIAASVLSPFLTKQTPNLAAIEELAATEPLVAAEVASAAADALFRLRRYLLAKRTIQQAEHLITHRLGGCVGVELARSCVLRVRTLARAARIYWCVEHSGEMARKYVKQALETLEHVAEYIPVPVRLSLEAFILDMWASWDWMAARQSEARAKAYRALSILRRPELDDSSRLGHALLTACRVESSAVSATRYRFLTADLDEAWDLFPVEHGLRPQPMILKAQIQAKAGLPIAALETLESVRPKDHVQHTETIIARVWLLRRDRAWKDALRKLRAVAKTVKSLPRRFDIEVKLQLGAVLLESGDQIRLTEAVGHLEDARDVARTHGREKHVIAANLYLARAYHRLDRLKLAVETLSRARSSLARTRSTFLSEYLAKEVEPEFRRADWVHSVPAECDYSDEVARFRFELSQQLVTYHGGYKEAGEQAKVDPRTLKDNLAHRRKVSPDALGSPDALASKDDLGPARARDRRARRPSLRA